MLKRLGGKGGSFGGVLVGFSWSPGCSRAEPGLVGGESEILRLFRQFELLRRGKIWLFEGLFKTRCFFGDWSSPAGLKSDENGSFVRLDVDLICLRDS